MHKTEPLHEKRQVVSKCIVGSDTPDPLLKRCPGTPVKEALILNKPPADVGLWSWSLQKPANIRPTVCGVLLSLTSLDCGAPAVTGSLATCPQTPLPPICPQPATLVKSAFSLLNFLEVRRKGKGLFRVSYLEGITSEPLKHLFMHSSILFDPLTNLHPLQLSLAVSHPFLTFSTY